MAWRQDIKYQKAADGEWFLPTAREANHATNVSRCPAYYSWDHGLNVAILASLRRYAEAKWLAKNQNFSLGEGVQANHHTF